jgi:hypothetical protein
VQNDQPENWIVEHNIAFGKKTDNIKGITNKEIDLIVNKSKLLIPTENTDKIDRANLKCDLPKIDLFGQSYTSNSITVGAIQYPILKEIKLPLSETFY